MLAKILFCFLAASAWAQESLELPETQLRLEEPKDLEVKSKRRFSLKATLDVQARESRLKRATNSRNSAVRELSLGATFHIQDELDLVAEGSAEEFNGRSEFFVKEAYLNLQLPQWRVSSQVGQFFYPVGWLSREDNYFSSTPNYYGTLFKGDKGIDLGVALQVHPFGSPVFSLEGSCFEGRVFRRTDQRQEAAEQRPCALGVRSKSDWGEFYYTHFSHDLAFYDPIQADGLGARSEFQYGGFWAEYWRIEMEQAVGPTALTQAGFLYPYVNLWRLRVGYRWAPSRETLSYETLGKVTSRIQDDLWRVEFKILEPLKLVFEDQKVRQVNGPYVKDEWSTRVVFQFPPTKDAQWPLASDSW